MGDGENAKEIIKKILSDDQKNLAKETANQNTRQNVGFSETAIVNSEINSPHANQRAAGVARSQSNFDVDRYLSVGADRQKLIDTYLCKGSGDKKDETRVFYYTGEGENLVVSKIVNKEEIYENENEKKEALRKTRKDENCSLQKVEISINEKGWTISSFVQAVVNIMIRIVGSVGVIALVWGGIMLITANGDDGQIQNAKDVVLYAVIGVVVAYMANLLIGLLWAVV
jgi:hypothetical protein